MVTFTIHVLIDWRGYLVSKCLRREKFIKQYEVAGCPVSQ